MAIQAMWRRWLVSALLAGGVALAGLPGVTWAQDRPDLKIEVDGFEPPTLEHTIRFKVTNVGKARSTAIKARIQTVSGGPPNVSEPDVPRLAPNESTVLFYGIGSCDGQVVQATVNDPLDFPSPNDRAEKVCPAKPQPGGGPNPTERVDEGLDDRIAVLKEARFPERLQLGEHDLPFDPSYARRHQVDWRSGLCDFADADAKEGPELIVGWAYDDGNGCDRNNVHQLVADFDLSWLRDLDKKLIFRAELLFDEEGLLARNNDGDGVPLGPCSGQLGLAPRGWQDVVAKRGNDGPLLTTEDVSGDRILDRYNEQKGRWERGWDVTDDIRSAGRKDLPADQQWHGLVLHSANEYVGAESDGACLSKVSNIRLRLHYIVVER